MTDPRDQGCLCQACGDRYKVDLMLPDELWARISGGKNLLCGRCIMTAMEGLGSFAALFIRTEVESAEELRMRHIRRALDDTPMPA